MEEKELQKKSYSKVIDYIKHQIMAGQLRIGDKLPAERELSEALGVSRNSVREAVRTLDIMGVISSQHGAGNYVQGNFENNLVESMSMMFLLNQINYEQISQLRLGLEMQALMLSIDNITEPELKQMEQIISQLENVTEENNVILDKKLHYSIAVASGNVLILNILQALSTIVDQFIVDLRREILSSEDSKAGLCEAHKGMVRSLLTKDKELGRKSVYKHFALIDDKLKNFDK
ncbi:FadR/GntR family transcriptional regulator [Lachnoclostridium phytofermentans]|uniref:Regulatory protein GntR HTH n=1 Tax=Lachnoclostridium phytofermentans (strain ATCC 700394 / DSM 18823 / ISDg) TaxID=357809 RepID=A9KNT9_LACP7|nr:FadR/GntR family transcriptional regulator [Lachnoclostridium phytofermentans]ABX41690.1 regulatory protein GntR HTH [Lachnoclostridium phytofermentans ISDg]